MLEDTATTGSISTSNHDKKILAKQSHKFNSKNQKFREIFPDYLVKNEESVDKEIESSIDPNLLQQQPLRHEIKENFIQLKTFAYLMIGLLFYILLNKFTNRL